MDLIFGMSFGYCMYLVVKTFLDYLDNPVLTNIQLIYEQPTLFPAVTICSLNPFNDVDPNNKAFFDKIISDNNLTDSYTNDPNLYRVTTSKLIKAYISTLSDSEKRKFGMEILSNSFIVQFNGFPVQNSDFEWFYDFDYINCYKFNGNANKLRYMGRSGFLSGLRLEIFIGNSSSYSYFSNKRGLKVIVHNHTEATLFPEDEGIEVSPGFVNNIKINRVYYNRLGYPFNECVDDVTASYTKKTSLMKMMFEQMNQTKYTMSYCLKLCFQIYLIKNCNCSDPSIPSFSNNITKCTNKVGIVCLESRTQTFYADPTLYCGNNCPVRKLINYLLINNCVSKQAE